MIMIPVDLCLCFGKISLFLDVSQAREATSSRLQGTDNCLTSAVPACDSGYSMSARSRPHVQGDKPRTYSSGILATRHMSLLGLDSRGKSHFVSVRSSGPSTTAYVYYLAGQRQVRNCFRLFLLVVNNSCKVQEDLGKCALTFEHLYYQSLPAYTTTALFLLNLITRTWSVSMRPCNTVKHTRSQDSGSEIAQFPQQHAATGLMMNPFRWSFKFYLT